MGKKKQARPPFENEVILFGADHYNTLAVLRCLGQQGCRVQLLIHHAASKGAQPALCIAKSRYAKRLTVLAEEPAQILAWLEQQAEPDRKKILLPCSDFAAYLLDTHAQQLAAHYLFPGFQGKPGQVACMMDKYRQKEFAAACGIPMAKSWSLHRGEAGFALPPDLCYPCIFKPQVSAEGKKSDICTADTPQQALAQLEKLAARGYATLLVQEYIQMDYEAVGLGCVVSALPGVFSMTLRKLRVWPVHGGGSTACACCEHQAPVQQMTRRIASSLRQQGYRGLYDIDLFVCGEQVYLNEINFRSSGVGSMLNDCGIPAAYLCCLDLLGLPLPPCPETVSDGYYMDELNELYGRKDNRLSPAGLLGSALRADSHAVFCWRDLPGSWGFYRPVLSRAWDKRWRRLTQKDHG